ncbi:exosortase C-terminal domain/associated protein EpsI [uncultured Desulfosarcina sp.]|uniref:exosortase C-terminal domain/associated protein EpsI n=1 Tax=uncultured Desulfosarcina sp. TaxID=218289 RepID=UPI0029C83B0B|nr:exosortase C-terminal domain/associated protein EpsI [uncultured Desulfosarcina sp.]
MGNKIEFKLTVLIGFFLATCIFVYGFNQPTEIKEKPPLTEYFRHVDGYENLGFVWMADNHVKMLQLDDYVFANFKRDGNKPNLYIGYYYSADKAYRAHSPLVCYPAQGWKVDSKPVIATLETGPYTINYEEIVTSFGRERELVLYWYQSHLLTNTQVYKNKIDMAYNKLVNNDEQHAFVRVAVPFEDSPYADVKKSAVDFINAFYPRFVEFIKAEG